MRRAGVQPRAQGARCGNAAGDATAAALREASVLYLQLVQPLRRVVSRVDQFEARHPLRLVVKDVLPGRLHQELAVFLKSAGEQPVAEPVGFLKAATARVDERT